MSQAIRAALRAAIHQAIAVLGEKEARRLVEQAFGQYDDDHWGHHGGR